MIMDFFKSKEKRSLNPEKVFRNMEEVERITWQLSSSEVIEFIYLLADLSVKIELELAKNHEKVKSNRYVPLKKRAEANEENS
jgi:hypothetical protein